jgi:hypothetical protein
LNNKDRFNAKLSADYDSFIDKLKAKTPDEGCDYSLEERIAAELAENTVLAKDDIEPEPPANKIKQSLTEQLREAVDEAREHNAQLSQTNKNRNKERD